MTFHWWTFLFEVVNFAVLAYVLHRLLYRPLHDAIDRRRQANAQARAEAEKAQQEAKVFQHQLQTQLAELEQQRQAAVHQAREEAEGERRRLLAEAAQGIQARQEENRQALEQERVEALRALRAEVVSQAVALTRRLLSEAADQTLNRQLTLRLLQTLRGLTDAERRHVCAQLQADDVALLETAEEVDEATLAQVGEVLTAVVGKHIPVRAQVKPALLGGARLRVGGHVWDGTLSGQLPEADGVAAKGATP
jgi:F-type H+-transporting ATPase subunit b